MTGIRIALAAAALLLAAPAAFAQEPHEAHHPAGTAAEAPNAATATPAQQQPPSAGPMPGGMMSRDMMQMMMGMMSSGQCPMMGQAMGAMGQMMSPEHVEGRVAFLKAELQVTEAQQSLWNALAEAIRENARAVQGAMPGMPGGMMGGAGGAASTPVQRLELQEKGLAARLNALRQVKEALEPFYASLDAAQKQKADKLLVLAPMGMM